MDLFKIILIVIIFINVICIFLFFYGKNFIRKSSNDIKFLDSEKMNLLKEINNLTNKINEYNDNFESTKQESINSLKELEQIKNSVIEQYKQDAYEKFCSENKEMIEKYNNLTNEVEYIESGFYRDFNFKFDKSPTYKSELSKLDNLEKDMVKNGEALLLSDGYEKGIYKLVLRAFNKETDMIINSVTVNNFHTKSNQIQRAFDSINNNSIYVNLSYDFLDLKLKKLELAHEYMMKLDVENEILKEEREREKENRIAEKEIQEKKDKINKEIRHYNNAINELEEQLTVANKAEKSNLEKQLSELNSTLKQLEDENIDLDFKLNNVSAGYVYIISNVGSFGKDIYKIGVTRRENWHERIAELSSASVPFRFDENIIVFSKNAFELETNLHKYFDDRRVNLVNYRKEFFKVTLDEVKEALKKFDVYEFDSLNYETSDEYNQTLEILKDC